MVDRLLTPEELCDWLQVQKSTLYKWTHYQYVPFVKVGRFVRFRQSEIKAWLEKRSCQGRALGTVDVDGE